MRDSYASFLVGDSKVALALTQVQLALANFGTHAEVAQGRSDVLFDAVAAFVASDLRPSLFTIKQGEFTMNDFGRLVPVTNTSNATSVNEGFSIADRGKLGK